MKTNFDLFKNGKVSVSVWANPQTKEIYPANKNSFGHNAEHHHGNAFYARYGKNLKKHREEQITDSSTILQKRWNL